MWRRFGNGTYAVLLALLVLAQVVPLAMFLWSLGLRLAGRLPASRLLSVLMATVGMSALALVLLSTFVFGYHALSRRHERRRREGAREWVDRWVDVVLAEAAPPEPPLSQPAIDALLELRESLKGLEGDRVAELLSRYEVDTGLLRSLRSRLVLRRLEALEDLARARLPETFEALLDAISDAVGTVRLAAARAAARTLGSMSPGRGREMAAAQLAATIRASRLPTGAVEETLLLAQDGAGRLILDLLDEPLGSAGAAHAALEAAGRLRSPSLAGSVGRFIGHSDPELRAAALRGISRMAVMPEGAVASTEAAVTDAVEFVRVQAVQAARLLPRDTAVAILGPRLTDSSWWVRRRAAESLAQLGGDGAAALRHVAETHEELAVREMAAQVLAEAGSPTLERPRTGAQAP